MGKIQVLDRNTINQIAAGEVIERPASVVKELMENAIDALSTAVTVEIKDGGSSFIRITDNGAGIAKEDVENAFLRHATSKIKSAADLLTVASLGFRGEALSSIGAVAMVELVTKRKEDFVGTGYKLSGGEGSIPEDIGVPDGTTFIVRNLFYNTPARRKFLKTAATEAGYINDIVCRMAMAHPEVSIRFINNGKLILHTSGNGSLKDVIYAVYGKDIALNLLELDGGSENIRIKGYIGKPLICRGNRTYENYFINGRYIKSGIINKAIEEGYRSFMMQHKYPFTALHFEIKPEYLDVNVHPAKLEIRFRNSEELYPFIIETVSSSLKKKELIPETSLDSSEDVKREHLQRKQETLKKQRTATPEFFETNRIQTSLNIREEERDGGEKAAGESAKIISHAKVVFDPETEKVAEEQIIYDVSDNVGSAKTAAADTDNTADTAAAATVAEDTAVAATVAADTTAADIAAEDTAGRPESARMEADSKAEQLELFDDRLLSRSAREHHKIVGQVFDTYWIVQYGDKLFIIDQHAAHEKVLYERAIARLRERKTLSQSLNPPIILTLSMREREVLNEYKDCFTELGYEIEEFGGNEYAVRAVPYDLFSIAKNELLMEMIDELSDDTAIKRQQDLILDKVASMSCKAAVKGNNRLSAAEANALIDELLSLENPYNCPHGRPTIISMSKYELEKKFKRIV